MQELKVINVKTANFRDVNLNKIFDPNGQHKQSYEFSNSSVTQPYVSGEGKLSVAFYTLQPGKSSYPFHHHTGIEEVFYIINGKGCLETNEGVIEVSEGDVIVMPANENGAHMLTNNSDLPLTYLDIDTVSAPEVIVYPHTGNVRVMAGKIQKSFRIGSEVNYLDGE